MKDDPVIDAVREARRRVSESVGNDPRKLVEYYRRLQAERGERPSARPSGLIEHEELYKTFIRDRGVGANDHVSDSVKAYVSYLKTVSRLIAQPISPSVLNSTGDVDEIASKLSGFRSPKSITNYKSAMKQYVAMVQHYQLRSDLKSSITTA